MAKNLDIEFLEFLEPQDGVPKDVDITTFILKNFPIPNIEDFEAPYDDTDALAFLRKSNINKYFSYYADALGPIVNKFRYYKNGKEYRHWFGELEPHVFAKIQDAGLKHLYEYRTNEILRLTNQSTVDTNKALQRNIKFQIATGIITTAAIALTASIAVMAYNKDDSINLIQARKSLQQQEQILKNIEQSQKGIDTSLRTLAKKTSAKKN